MKHLLFVAGLICSLGFQAQVTSISVDTYYVHDGVAIPELAGFTTYHVVANTTSSEDFISAIYGDSENPLGLEADASVFQSELGFVYGNEVNPAMFAVFPILEYDSWMTIGMASSDAAGVLGNIGLNAAMADFASTGSFYVNDPIGGSLYNLLPCDVLVNASCVNSYPQFGGADNKVLLAQITTNGNFCGVFNLQAFVNGDQSLNEYSNGVSFCSDPDAVPGCMDPAASNYNPLATNDDYSCVLPCTIELVVESIVSPTCNGDNDGALLITASGAQGSDDYYLGEDDEIASNFGNFNSLLAGTYYVEVVDGAGCSSSQYIEIPVTETVTVDAELTDGIDCNDMDNAVIEANGMGGDGNLQFYIAGEDPSTMSDNSVFANLSAGTYSIIAVDGNGCTGSSIATLVTNPSAVNVYVTATSDASCSYIDDGVIVVSATGGAASSTLQFVVGGVTYPTSPIYVAGGTYNVLAIDVNGCTGSSEEIVIGPSAIEVNASATPVACTDDSNGVVSWAPSGGADGFSVTVDGSAVTGSSYEGLASGFYTVEVMDANDCTSQVVVEVLNAEPVMAMSSVVDVLCNGDTNGSAMISANGGTGSFQYSDNGNDFAANAEFGELEAGDYTFYAQDENGCISGTTAIVGEPDAIVISGTPVGNSSNSTASINVSVTGGTPDYTYLWSGTGVEGDTNQDIEELISGTYTLVVTDDNECTAEESFFVSSISDILEGVSMNIFPNPSTGMFNVEWTGWSGGDVVYSVIDTRGRQVLSGVWADASSSFNSQLDLSGIENGLYRLNVVANGVATSIQLVKVN
jgi:hypothetical protein